MRRTIFAAALAVLAACDAGPLPAERSRRFREAQERSMSQEEREKMPTVEVPPVAFAFDYADADLEGGTRFEARMDRGGWKVVRPEREGIPAPGQTSWRVAIESVAPLGVPAGAHTIEIRACAPARVETTVEAVTVVPAACSAVASLRFVVVPDGR